VGRKTPREDPATVDKYHFNYYQSRCVLQARGIFLVFFSPFLFVFCRTRTTIERAFGVLVAHFGVFWRLLKGSLAASVTTIKACMIIHNITDDEKEGELSRYPLLEGWPQGALTLLCTSPMLLEVTARDFVPISRGNRRAAGLPRNYKGAAVPRRTGWGEVWNRSNAAHVARWCRGDENKVFCFYKKLSDVRAINN